MSGQTKPARIALVIGSLQIGGAETQAVGLAVRLAQRGHYVKVISLMRGGPLEEDLRAGDVPYEVLGVERFIGRDDSGRFDIRETLRSLRRLVWFRSRLRKESIDVVHAFMLWPSAIALPLAAMSGVPVRVSGRRNLGTDVPGQRHPFVERVAAAAGNEVVAVSQAVATAVAAQGVRKKKLHVVYNGLGPTEAAGAVHAQPARGVMIANLIGYKGHRDLIEAMKLIVDAPAIDCYGDGPERTALQRSIEEANLANVIRLRGQVPQASRFYRDAQFAVLCSHEEGFPGAVLEAMAAGLPVVATAVGGVVEMISHDRSGLLVEPRDPPALARAIQVLASDPGLRVRLGEEARRSVQSRFSWDRCVQAHEEIYLRRLRPV